MFRHFEEGLLFGGIAGPPAAPFARDARPQASRIDAVPEESPEEQLDEPLVAIRSYFPETWLWKLSRTGWVAPS